MNIRNLFRYWRTVMMVGQITLTNLMNDGFILFAVFFQPMIIALLALFMLKEKGPDYGLFVVVGSGLTGLWSSLLFISGNSINDERWNGTLESLVAVPIPFEVIVFGKNLANVAQSILSMLVAYVLAALFFGYSLNLSQPFLFVVSLALTVFAFVSFGLLIAPIFVMYRSVQQWQNAMEFPVYILAGFLFPILLLPNWTTPLSYILPPYWAAVALHGTSSGNAPINELLIAWGSLILFSFIDLLIASKLFTYMLYKVRVDATLEID